MLMGVLLAAAVVLGWFLARGTAGDADPKAAVPAGTDRRLRWVERHPGEVNSGDVERVLLGAGLARADVRLVSDKALALGIRPFTMWMFARTYGARELAVAVAAEVPHDQLLEHLGEGTLPPFGELEVFARLNGLAAAALEAAPATGAAATDDGIRTARLPEAAVPAARAPRRADRPRTLADLDVHDPGDWPYGLGTPPQPPTPGPGGGGGRKPAAGSAAGEAAA